MMKRTLGLLLMLTAAVTFSAGAYNPYAPNPFDTMDRSSWEFVYLEALTEKGLTGVDKSRFSPDYSLTRYEMAQMVETAWRNRQLAATADQEKITKLRQAFRRELPERADDDDTGKDAKTYDWRSGEIR
ncbi:hypothetical protein [Megasphaera vaginalis (ex Srinivasan et al. 2021)]|nr:hypothetical protein [Megasphaera vaginalis (ex Srinivasan et al. 2021)]